MTLSICINGQLSLSMLIEEILLSIPDSQLIMANTDGFEVLIPRKYEELYYDLCKKWEITTKLELEYVDYQKMVISDVNNYIAIYANNKGVKCKGKYEFKDIPLHKNKSFNIIPLAIVKYFTEGIDIRETILNHTNIFDFCAGVRAKRTENSVRGDSYYELYTVEKGIAKSTKLSRTVRYYISNKGVTIRKKYQDGTIEEIEASTRYKTWVVTYFNKAFYPEEFKDYDIDYSYYIIKAREWINNIQDNQLKLTLWT